MERAVEKEWSENAWRGTPAGLADLLAEVARLVKQASGGDAESSAHITVTLGKAGGDLVFKAVPEFCKFAGTGGPTLAWARMVYASIGSQVGDVGVTVVLRRYRIPLVGAMTATVRGPESRSGQRLAPEVKTLLKTGGQPVPSWALYWAIWLVGVLITWGSKLVPDLAQGPVWAAGLGLLGAAFLFAVVAPSRGLSSRSSTRSPRERGGAHPPLARRVGEVAARRGGRGPLCRRSEGRGQRLNRSPAAQAVWARPYAIGPLPLRARCGRKSRPRPHADRRERPEQHLGHKMVTLGLGHNR